MTYGQSYVPEQTNDFLNICFSEIRPLSAVKHQKVNIRKRRKLSATITAERDHRTGAERWMRRVEFGCNKIADATDYKVYKIASTSRDFRSAKPETMANTQPLLFDLQKSFEQFKLTVATQVCIDRAKPFVRVKKYSLQIYSHANTKCLLPAYFPVVPVTESGRTQDYSPD